MFYPDSQYGGILGDDTGFCLVDKTQIFVRPGRRKVKEEEGLKKEGVCENFCGF